VLEGVSAAGVHLQPVIIDKDAAHWMGGCAYVAEDKPASFTYSPKGWTDSQVGVDHLVQVFEPQTAAV